MTDKEQKAWNHIWSSITDMLSQKEIERLERLHKKDIQILEGDDLEDM